MSPTFTKIYKVLHTPLEIELMSNGETVLWEGDEKILGTYAATKEAQQAMCDKIKELYPDWKEGQVERKVTRGVLGVPLF